MIQEKKEQAEMKRYLKNQKSECTLFFIKYSLYEVKSIESHDEKRMKFKRYFCQV